MSTSISSNQRDAVPEPVAHVADVMTGYGKPWCMCGGWAVDAWIGHFRRFWERTLDDLETHLNEEDDDARNL